MSAVFEDLAYLDDWADRVIEPADVTHYAVDRETGYRVLLPAPDWAVYAHVGDCAGCGRPMATVGERRRVPALRLYYARVAGVSDRCRGCARRPGTEGVRRRGVRAPDDGRSTPLTPERLAYLRGLVPCLGCGEVRREHRTRHGTRAVLIRHRPGCDVAGRREG